MTSEIHTNIDVLATQVREAHNRCLSSGTIDEAMGEFHTRLDELVARVTEAENQLTKFHEDARYTADVVDKEVRKLEDELVYARNELERWRERTRYLLTTDPSEWEPEVIRWLARLDGNNA